MHCARWTYKQDAGFYYLQGLLPNTRLYPSIWNLSVLPTFGFNTMFLCVRRYWLLDRSAWGPLVVWYRMGSIRFEPGWDCWHEDLYKVNTSQHGIELKSLKYCKYVNSWQSGYSLEFAAWTFLRDYHPRGDRHSMPFVGLFWWCNAWDLCFIFRKHGFYIPCIASSKQTNTRHGMTMPPRVLPC